MADISDLMGLLKGSDVYIHSSGGNPWDPKEIVFHAGGKRVAVECGDSVALSYLSSSLHHLLDPHRVLVAWGVKEMVSFLKARTEVLPEIGGRLFDLSLVCSYLSIDAAAPGSFKEAVGLLRRVMGHPGWPVFRPFYEGVYLPLATAVLPEIETCCLVDNSRRSCVYPMYEIEGQANGRLKALAPTESHYNPHSLGPDRRRDLRPAGWDDEFVSFDYRNMEVNVLQWLSGDPALGAILEGEEDPYVAIWSRVTRGPAGESQRRLCKDVFLPVVFGQGARSLAERIGREEKIAAGIIDRLVDSFPVAFDWVRSQSPDGDDMAVDRFGRRRAFVGRELYKIRNFAVQSPASMICLRKLVRLHDALAGLGRVCFHVHDGYSVVCDKNEVDSVYEAGIRALEEEDPMFPGLRLRATCRHGNRLDGLSHLEKRGVET